MFSCFCCCSFVLSGFPCVKMRLLYVAISEILHSQVARLEHYKFGPWLELSQQCLQMHAAAQNNEMRFSGPLDRSFPWPRAVHETGKRLKWPSRAQACEQQKVKCWEPHTFHTGLCSVFAVRPAAPTGLDTTSTGPASGRHRSS